METGTWQQARILSMDVGSSSVRAGFYDGTGEEVENTEVKLDYDFAYTADGGAPKDADELLDLVARAVDGALSRAEDGEISCVAMSTFWSKRPVAEAIDVPTLYGSPKKRA